MSAIEPFDARRVRRADGLPDAFNAAGVLAAADVHVAARLATLCGEGDESVRLAAALAVRAPRLGHVHVDLATIRETATVDADEPVDLEALPWPDVEPWVTAVAASPLVAVGEDDEDAVAPLRLVGTRLHLDRYWREERRLAADLVALASSPVDAVDDAVLADGLRRLFRGEGGGRQALAAATAVLGRFTVVAGGPGTGKTTTVARLLALLLEQHAATGAPTPLIALAAPTGKAAARLQEAVHEEAVKLDTSAATRDALLALESSTLHRLLGWRPDSSSRFRHDRRNRLPHDVVVVDETSMVSLWHMARLTEAVRPDARLVLVGDPQQLVSIEAGAVLGDVVGPAADGLRLSPARRARLTSLTGTPPASAEAPPGAAIADSVVVLERVHRFGEEIARVADAVRRGDPDATVAALRSGAPAVRWIEEDAADGDAITALATIRDLAVDAGLAVADAARFGDATAALTALAAFRVLCAHRRGDHGVATWSQRIESWLATARPDLGIGRRWYPGRPLLVTENDYELGLYNGDTGVIIDDAGRLRAAFERRGEIVLVSPSRLQAVETLYAMTIHKAQGSQVGTAVVLLPDEESRLLTRELLYTALTRARHRLLVLGSPAAVTAAVARCAARASQLQRRLLVAPPRT